MNPSPRSTAIIGSGIVGLAHAWAAARAGDQVTVFERSDKARGASVRNFGMFWPIGQTPPNLATALRSGELWRELSSALRITARPCGSVCVVDHDDEAAVLEEFSRHAPDLGYSCELWTREKTESRCPGVRPGVAKAALFSPTETNLDPREALAALPLYLSEKFDVRFHWRCPVTQVVPGKLQTAGGSRHRFDRVFICSGHDLETLFPEVLAASPLRLCKLQMMRTVRQPSGWSLGPMLSSGLTLRHYDSFSICPTIAAVKSRIARDSPELDQYGIHVMASQDRDGALVLGDSHEYGGDIEVFDKSIIDSLILRELRKLFDFPDWSIAERWHGIYAKHPTAPIFRAEPLPGIHIATGTGGSGMTLSFGLAEDFLLSTPTPA